MTLKRLLSVGIIIGLVGCQAEKLEVDDKQSNLTSTKGAAAALSESEYDSLLPEQQYRVANKLAATLYKGIPANEFFNLKNGTEALKVAGGKDYLTDTRNALATRLDSKSGYVNAVERRYDFDEQRKPTAEPLANIREFPLSRDMFEEWMAYTLANTILFSPAEEIDSASYTDVQRVYDGLVRAMSEDVSIRQIILTHQKSQANWRRFRSPEDNVREMIEIYLGLFDRDEDVPKAAIACKNWYITDDAGGYELIIDFSEENTEPQKVLDSYWVTTCEDFYEAVANHPLVIPRITTFLVDRFFPHFDSQKRAAIVQDIVATNPVRFHDIFTPIIFSKAYLLDNAKPKSFEETFFNLAERTKWENHRRFLNELTRPDGAAASLHNMKQPAMSLKLGRFKDQPLDSLSFAYYHSALREKLFVGTETRTWRGEYWGKWGETFITEGDYLEEDDFLQFLFLTAASRKATSDELSTLKQVIVETGNEENRTNQAKIAFDYIVRLPEIYYYNKI